MQENIRIEKLELTVDWVKADGRNPGIFVQFVEQDKFGGNIQIGRSLYEGKKLPRKGDKVAVEVWTEGYRRTLMALEIAA
jgi:hypothetical protein